MGYARKDVEEARKYHKKFVRYKEGAEKYSLGLTKFQELAKEATLCVGDCEYNTVLLPAMYSIDQTTAELLERFTQNGGLLFSMGKHPRLLEGKECEPAGKIETLISEWRGEETVQTIRDRNEFSIRIMDETGNEIPDIHVMCRSRGSQRFYFLANLSKDKTRTARIEIENIDYIEIWDAWEYKKQIPDVCRDGKKTSFLLTINAMEAVLLSGEKKEEIIEVQNKLVIKNADMNSITLDCAEYRIDGGEWRKQKAVIRIMKELLSAGRNVPVELRFYCDIECNPKKLGPIYLAMETCEKYEVTINKKSFIFVPDGFFRDSAFQKADITGYLTEGKNEILLKTNFYDVILPLFPAYTGAQFMAALFSGLYIGSGCIRYDGRN